VDKVDGLKVRENMLFIAADGDGIGKQVGRAVIADDVEQLHKISERIDAAQEYILHWSKQNDGIKISGGGDEFTAAIPKEVVHQLESLRKDIEHAFGYTISIGVGKSLSEAGTALLVAKLRGKNRIVWFTKKIKEDIKKAKRRVREKRATPDEYKLSEAYLKKGESMNDQNCPYCEQTDGIDSDHCKMCHDMEPAAGAEACPFCTQNGATDEFGNPDSAPNDCPFCADSKPDADDCPYCKDDAASGPKQPEMAAQDDHAAQENTSIQVAPADDGDQPPDGHVAEQNPKIQSPDSNNATAPQGSAQEQANYDQMGMNPPIIGKPEPGNNSSPAGMGDANTAYGTAPLPVEPPSAEGQEVESGAGIMPEGAHSKETLEAIADQIANETVDGKPGEAQEARNIDDTAISGGGTEANVSRPPGYEGNTPGDLGLDEQEAQDGNPDLSSVLKEGLDDQANELEKDKVREMVGQALSGFKASKDILEKAKEQAPQFYQASIAMLAAMIKMAEMLGLKGSGETVHPEETKPENTGVQGEGVGGAENEWHDPFPKHPDHGGEKKPGHAPSKEEGAGGPKTERQIGSTHRQAPK
jgi:hypothetical protein